MCSISAQGSYARLPDTSVDRQHPPQRVALDAGEELAAPQSLGTGRENRRCVRPNHSIGGGESAAAGPKGTQVTFATRGVRVGLLGVGPGPAGELGLPVQVGTVLVVAVGVCGTPGVQTPVPDSVGVPFGA
ncbi:MULTISPECIES: hypothetical protein [Kribbella]|uniref:hypothetical protein n=1 Tax=Kribbella TaxID=182639 RepID=UPI001051FEE1|nr:MULTISPECIES: hypothetical protein [Kribbella]